jgi:hypothetical protein
MRPSCTAIFTILLGVLTVAPARAEDEPDMAQMNRDKLRGIKEFAVFVIPQSPSTDTINLDATGLQTAAEATLRKARLPLVATKELPNTPTAPSKPILDIEITSLAVPNTGLVAVLIEYRMTEIVVPFRQPVTKIVGSTWRFQAAATVGAKNVNDVRKFMVDQLDTFINDYLAANPTR